MSILLQNKIDRMEKALAESRISLEVAADAPIEDFVAKTKFNNTLNIYCQEEEPENKEGLWLKTNRNYDLIMAEPYIAPTTLLFTDKEPMAARLLHGSRAVIGDYLYYFGGWGTSENKNEAYKWHIPTNTLTRLTNVPSPIEWGSEGIVIGTDIYFGGTHANTNFYKFDTITETYTKLTNSPAQLYGSTMVVTPDHKYIYAFGGIYDYNYKPYYRQKYDIENNTWTYTRNNPIQFGGGAAFVHGNAVYFPCARLITSWTNVAVAPKTYKFDFGSETWSTLKNGPNDCCCFFGCVVGDDIYFITSAITSGPVDEGARMYRYHVPTDTFTRLDNVPVSDIQSKILIYRGNNEFIIPSCDGNERRNVEIKIPVPEHKSYNKDTIIIWENISYRNYYSPAVQLCHFGPGVEGFKNINKFYVRDITYQTAEGEDIDSYPVYYGDGEKWNLLKEGNN